PQHRRDVHQLLAQEDRRSRPRAHPHDPTRRLHPPPPAGRMSLQKRLVALVALLLVVGLAVADVVTYASVHSFLYGQADNTLAQNESLGFNYLTYAAERGVPITQADLSRRISSDVYVIVLNRHGKVMFTRPSGSAAQPDPSPILTKGMPVQQ